MLKRTQIFSIFALMFILAVALAGCAPQMPKHDARTIVIAVVEADPGKVGNPNPQSAYAGILLAADQMKERGGVALQVIPYADDGDPAAARKSAEEIVQGNAVAVIGHSTVETSQAAAEVYDKAGIPVINYVPVTENLTSEHLSYFNTTYTAESEAAYIANYLWKIKNATTATVVSTNDGYGKVLARQFKNTFHGLGGRIMIDEVVRSGNTRDLETVVEDIISRNPETDNPGTIFIATDQETAAQLVILMKQKGISYPIAGASTLGTPGFLKIIKQQPEEGIIPGYYTDGILTTRAIIFDSANRYASQFRADYQAKYEDDPSDRVVNGYSAALVLMSAFQNAAVSGDSHNVAADRQEVYKTLLAINDTENSVQGIIGQIYFEPSRNITRAARFGIYQNGKLVSANTQFEPIAAPNAIRNLQEQIARNRIMTVNGAYIYKANVVYAGVDLLGIEEIDIKTSTYKVDFYLWFRYRPSEGDEEFKPDDFVFTNAEGDVETTLIRDETDADGTHLKTYRVSGVFKHQFKFYEYPFDRQNLIIEFRNQNANTSFIQYVVDQIGMRYPDNETLLDNFRANGAFDAIYGWDEKHVSVTQDTFPTYTTFGSPQNYDSRVATNYSVINLNVEIQRSSLQYIIKSLLPLLITLILAYITFFLPLGHSERLAVGSTALLTTAFFHLTLADALPEIGYTVAMEYLFYASYLMSALIVLMETLSIRYEKASEDATKKTEKELFQTRREKLNMVGRLIYPAILFFVMGAGFLVYFGKLPLVPKEAGTRQLVEIVRDHGSPRDAKQVGDGTAADTGGTIRLSLSTWRPEDSEQIDVLLAAFHKYAKNTLNKEIVIDHKPVVSVNYDSILDLQLGSEQGPDLFYVRPFSVDGNIAKYLEPLNDLSLDVNFDATKITPWKNRAGTNYAVPYVGVVQGVYYNQDLFERYGLSVPQTWSEFLQNLAVIVEKNPNMIPIANSLNDREDSEMFMSIAANFLGGPDGRARLMRTDGTSLCFDSRVVVDAFRAIESIKPYLPKDAANMDSRASKELFFDRKAVMLFGGSWDLQKVSEKANFKWGVFAVPAPAMKQTYVIFQPDIGVGINKASLHREEAAEFLTWLMSEEAVNLTAENLAGFYPLNATKPSVTMGANDQKFLDLAKQYPGDIRWMFTQISDKYPGADKIIIRNLNEIIASGLTPEEAAQRLQAGLGEWYAPAQNCRR